jgi:peptide/nickel transport system substrate-binding protein
MKKGGVVPSLDATSLLRKTFIVFYYPEGHLAYRPEAYDGWVESPGFGIVHKWSFLPEEVRNEANAVAEESE